MHEWIIQCVGMHLKIENGKDTAEAETVGETGDVTDEAEDDVEEAADESADESEDGGDETANDRTARMSARGEISKGQSSLPNAAEESNNVATCNRANDAEGGVDSSEYEL